MQRIRKSLAISLHLAAIYFAALLGVADAQDWPTFRHDNARTGTQPAASDLSDPKKVPSLSIKWTFPGRSMVTSGPFVNVYAGHDQQHFAYLTANGDIWDAFYRPGCSGNGWLLQKINDGGVTTGPPAIAGPFIDTYAEHDQQHFAYLSDNGDIWDAFYCPGCSGDQWRLQKINNGGATSAPAAVAAPFVNVYSGNDQQHFVYLAANGDIWDAFYCAGCSGNRKRSITAVSPVDRRRSPAHLSIPTPNTTSSISPIWPRTERFGTLFTAPVAAATNGVCKRSITAVSPARRPPSVRHSSTSFQGTTNSILPTWPPTTSGTRFTVPAAAAMLGDRKRSITAA